MPGLVSVAPVFDQGHTWYKCFLAIPAAISFCVIDVKYDRKVSRWQLVHLGAVHNRLQILHLLNPAVVNKLPHNSGPAPAKIGGR